jgi:hypothetical protein
LAFFAKSPWQNVLGAPSFIRETSNVLFQALAGLPVVLGALLFIGIVVVVSLAGAFAFHRLVPHAVLAEHNEIAGFVFAVVGVVYAVLLAFLAIGVWEHYETAQQRTYDEAGRLTVVYRKSDLFAQTHLLRAELTQYVRAVIADEWPRMQRGEHDPHSRAIIERIAYQVRHLPVTTMAQQNVHAAMTQSIDDAMVDRDDRISLATLGVNQFLWWILIAGAVVTIFFAYLFAYRNAWSLIAIVGLLAFMLGLVLYLIAAVDYPFRGEIRVGPEAFTNALREFKIIGP